jgi:hypothetical protein
VEVCVVVVFHRVALLSLSNGIVSHTRLFIKCSCAKNCGFRAKSGRFIWFIPSGFNWFAPFPSVLINNSDKVNVKAYVNHFPQSIIPDAGILFYAAGSMSRIRLVNLAPADVLYTLKIFFKIPVNVSDVIHFICSFTLGVLPSF